MEILGTLERSPPGQSKRRTARSGLPELRLEPGRLQRPRLTIHTQVVRSQFGLRSHRVRCAQPTGRLAPMATAKWSPVNPVSEFNTVITPSPVMGGGALGVLCPTASIMGKRGPHRRRLWIRRRLAMVMGVGIQGIKRQSAVDVGRNARDPRVPEFPNLHLRNAGGTPAVPGRDWSCSRTQFTASQSMERAVCSSASARAVWP